MVECCAYENVESWLSNTCKCYMSLWLRNWQLQSCCCVLVHEASEVMLPNSLFPCRLTCGLLKNHRTPQQPFCLMPSTPAVPVQFHNCNDIFTRVAGRLWVPNMCSRDILHQAKEGSSSTQIRWFSRRSGGGGWFGRAVAQRSLKTRVKMTVRLPLQWDSSQGSQTGGQWAK
jgi:hypothetical protein